jgi:hypothetical protein
VEGKKVKILALPEWQIDDPLRVVFTRLISGGHQFVISNSNEGPPSCFIWYRLHHPKKAAGSN